ncbi:unnamed protein product [Candida verbasci]|uniref:methionine--tRNA ligase n=1 Tax=Candida verbasci TaxID=1227364 RepID=A0A9W4U020_9ASCO|nr:unnamed protein product [Candida verbasci]
MVEVFASKGNNLLTLVDNLKLAIALSVYTNETLKLHGEEKKCFLIGENLKLVEPNSIVKYLAKNFTKDEFIDFEEDEIYPKLKNKKDIGDLKTPDKVELNPSQIILFSSLYPTLKDSSNKWFNEFESQVTKGIENGLSITHQERAKEEHTGKQNFNSSFQVKPQDKAILPKDGERNILITSALPYVNNVPHLGNIIGSVLSADIFSRYVKNRNYNAIYICGTDEYGTATETKALEEGVTPYELCTKYHKIHKEVYDWFDINFDYFGRTTTELQTEIAQDIFIKLYNNDYLTTKTNEQLYCEHHKSFLADRFVEGTCPKCQYEDARGDQCDKCGSLLDPEELIEPRCKVDGTKPIKKSTTHVYLKLDELQEPLKEWVDKASVDGSWTKNSKQITNNWINKGLEPRCITRDLIWGTPVPLEEFKDKVLYVWFDATIGYVSITANYFKEKSDYKLYEQWWKNPENVDLYQFMGKDNTPFHTVVFPSSLIGTKDKWTKLHHINTTEYLQYEGGKFSKSRGIGVFGNSAKETGLSSDVWRFYLCSVRPESNDSQFSWDEFVACNNNILLANFGNFVNRVIKYLSAKYNQVIPKFDLKNLPEFEALESEVNKILKEYIQAMEVANLRKGLELVMAISAKGNQFLQENKLDNSLYLNKPDKCDAVVNVAINLIYLLSATISPFMPGTSKQIQEMLNAPPLSITDKFELVLLPGHNVGKAQYLFKRIEESKIEEWRNLYGGQQKK